jgi:hypothetical protein
MKIRNLLLTLFVFSVAIGIAMTAVSDDSMSYKKAPSQSSFVPRNYLKVPNQHSPSSFRIAPPMLRNDIDVVGTTYLGEDSDSL